MIMKNKHYKANADIGELKKGDFVVDSRGFYHMVKKHQIGKRELYSKTEDYFYKDGGSWYLHEKDYCCNYRIVRKGVSNQALCFRSIIGGSLIALLFLIWFNFHHIYYIHIPLTFVLFISIIFYGGLLYVSLLKRYMS